MKMTPEEIHQFGIEIVHDQLIKDGYEIKAVYAEMGKNPQIVAQKNDQLAFIAVRTACYPEKGQLEENVHFNMIDHASQFKAIPYFASVGIAKADAETEADRGIPVKGAGFHASYEGLLMIARSDRVQILPSGTSSSLISEGDDKTALTEKDAAIAYAKAWNRLDCTAFLELLAEDSTYESQWVLEKLAGRKAIAHYLTSKMEMIKASEKNVRAELTTARCGYDSGRDCVVLKQDQNKENDAVMIIQVENGQIKRCDLCAPELFGPAPTDIYPI